MSADAHKNFAYSTIATAPAPAASGVSLVVFAGDGLKFPAASFNATVWPANTQPTTANAEIVRVTVIATDTFTITRAQEGTAARTILVGDQIAATITAKTLTDVETPLSGTSGGVLAYTSATTPVSSAALGANALVLGGGAGAVPFSESGFTIEQTQHSLSSTTQPRASAFNSATQSVGSGAFAALTMDSEDYDVGNMHSVISATSRVTVPAGGGGLYYMRAAAVIGTSVATKVGLELFKNGTTSMAQRVLPASGTIAIEMEISALLVLAAADFIEVRGFQDSGGNVNFGAATRANAAELQLVKLW